MSVELALLSRVAFRGREISGPRLRGLVALLAADLPTGSSIGRLVDGLWPDEQPDNPTKALQVLVFRARSLLGSDVLVSTPTGYRLDLADDQVDSAAVLVAATESTRAAQAGDHQGALTNAEAGLALWDGAPDDTSDLGDPVSQLRAERARTYDVLARSRALALARLGRRAEAAAPLAELFDTHPRDEELLLELLRSEAEAAGPSVALATYDAYRRGLRGELGTDPGPALRAEYQRLLQGEAPTVRHGVVHDPNPLLGRDADVEAVTALVRTSRVTSIVGPGGLGKTRLAHAVSRRAEQRLVHVVALAGVTADVDVASEVAAVVGLGGESPGGLGRGAPQDVVGALASTLTAGPTLLVLDNCEHVLDGVAELVQALVSMTQDLRVLTTSRAPLGLSSESVYLLPELSLAVVVELFGQRARAARPDIDLPADVVAELCRRLDGLPLAVELAAARVRVLSVAEIARGLDDRFALLRGGPRDIPERHRTLSAVVDWSWALLAPADQDALCLLSIFPDGFTAEAAGYLVGPDALSRLEHLVDHSLLKVTETETGMRFRMLETIREFAADRRERAGRADAAVDGFLSWVRDFGAADYDGLLRADPVRAARRLKAEQDNLVQALRFALARADGAAVGAATALVGGLWAFESNYTRLLVLVEETGPVLARYRPEPRYVETTRAAATITTLASFMLRGVGASRALVALRRLPPVAPDTAMRALATVLAAAPTLHADDFAALRAMCDSDQPLLAAMANAFATYVWEGAGDPERAKAAAERMLAALRGQANPWMEAQAHSRIAELALQVHDGETATQELLAALSVVESLGHWPDVLKIKWALVLAALQTGDVDAAEHWLAQTTLGEVEYAAGVLTFDLAVRAEIALARGDIETGLRTWRDTVARIDDESRRTGYSDISAQSVQSWSLEVRAATVIAHARHHRLDLVESIVGDMPGQLGLLLSEGIAMPRICGALLLTLGMVDIERGEHATGARLVALADRLGYVREFQPTMSGERARHTVENADRSAYDEAVSSYADLDRDGLRAAALDVLARRRAVTSPSGRG